MNAPTPGAAVRFLVDGYNLLYAAGFAPPPGGPRAAFDAARRRFLDWLADAPAVKADPSAVRVVFDAQNSTRDFGSTTHRGLVVTFSFGQTADDLIEALLNVESHAVAVVSDDGRLKESARRRRCRHFTCAEFMDWLQRPPAAEGEPVRPPDDKPPPDWPDEMERLMEAFR